MNYKQLIIKLIEQGVDALSSILGGQSLCPLQVEATKEAKHGDYACNVALMMAKKVSLNPRELAEKIKAAIPEHPLVVSITIAGPGFLNFTIDPAALRQVIPEILSAGKTFGESTRGSGKRVHVEFVSANPTGPLHVGHGRGAAFGACVSSLLKAIGFDVHREYYVNDAGRQMRILALSVWLRYLEVFGAKMVLPENAYQGEYIINIAQELATEAEKKYFHDYNDFIKALSDDITADSPDAYLDHLIDTLAETLGQDGFETVRQFGLQRILADIEDDLSGFGVEFDEWFPESRLMKAGLLTTSIDILSQHGHVYAKDGATWFKATAFGDDKDRVLIRENGLPTYFASDVAYHLFKYDQGYDQMVDVFGADHHGYIARINAFLQGLGKDPEKLQILLVQFAILYRGKEKVSMSTRGGQFVTLRELRREVGNDAARLFYIMRKPEQHLDFDLELAKSTRNENPVYYIQYAYARICSVWRQREEQGLVVNNDKPSGSELALLTLEHEAVLIRRLIRYPEVIESSALNYEPHLLAHYLHDVAHVFHSYYNATKFLVAEESLRHARLSLVAAIQCVLANGLALLGLSAPKKM